MNHPRYLTRFMEQPLGLKHSQHLQPSQRMQSKRRQVVSNYRLPKKRRSRPQRRVRKRRARPRKTRKGRAKRSTTAATPPQAKIATQIKRAIAKVTARSVKNLHQTQTVVIQRPRRKRNASPRSTRKKTKRKIRTPKRRNRN